MGILSTLEVAKTIRSHDTRIYMFSFSGSNSYSQQQQSEVKNSRTIHKSNIQRTTTEKSQLQRKHPSRSDVRIDTGRQSNDQNNA